MEGRPLGDAVGQLRTLVSTDVLRGLLYLLLAAIWTGLGSHHQLVALFAISFAANIGSAFFTPAILAMPVALVKGEAIQQLTALVDSCFSLGNVLGPVLSAVLYPWTGLRGLFLVNGLSYLFAALLEARIRMPRQDP